MYTLNYINERNYNGFEDWKEIVADFHNKRGIEVSYENISVKLQNDVYQGDVRRKYVLKCRDDILTNRNNYIVDNMARECNRLVLEAHRTGPEEPTTWSALVVPPEWQYTTIPSKDVRLVNEHLRQNLYTVYPVEDCTLINLHYGINNQKLYNGEKERELLGNNAPDAHKEDAKLQEEIQNSIDALTTDAPGIDAPKDGSNASAGTESWAELGEEQAKQNADAISGADASAALGEKPFNEYEFMLLSIPRWIISTAKGLDMNATKFNTLSYMEILNELVTHAGLDVRTFYESLDTNRSYTFSIRHPDLHPFNYGEESNKYVKYVQSVVTRPSGEPLDVHQNDLAFLKQVHKVSPWPEIRSPVPIEKRFKNLRTLFSMLKPAFERYMSQGVVNFGYTLISNSPEDTGEYSNIVLESTLIREIHNLWNNRSSSKKDPARYTTLRVIINSYLDNSKRDTFVSLFRQFEDQFDTLHKIELRVIDELLKSGNGQPKESNGQPGGTGQLKESNGQPGGDRFSGSLDFQKNKYLKRCVEQLLHQIKAKTDLTPANRSVMLNLIRNKQNLDIYRELFTQLS
jgi:hypothetical protein